MCARQFSFRLAVVLFSANLFCGCESTDSGSVNSSTTVYYGAAFYDPWYHGDYDDHDHDVVVNPPPSGGNRPPGSGDSSPRPEHPIANPPGGSERPPSASQLPASRPSGGASARPTPSIPSAPRASPRGGGGRGGGGRR